MLTYDPRAWYWRADDGRVFSSAALGLVPPTGPGLAAWLADGGIPTVWPRDDAGVQTQGALDAVLRAAGVLASVPDVSSAQAKIALIRAGHMPAVKAAVAASDEEVQVWFSDARTWQRHNPFVAAIGAGLGLSDAAIDALFAQAAAIAA
ncbi:hypothetical protein NS228_06125 [Methylobacterium indicum]|uniref:hypothetical protein n=1 Tax=Methylobacterium indicum TaxID=1775910 RepID=UPI000734AF46|nr:hypothetical protein [Methylobacterium indicum]KTS30873.1 hypothetical protein NS229_14705 [Methylobacterium indicum]KTS41539.1 hypothetical protein NS228_06125 [Methylobacterium indicum]KTS52407.1 hypothetical protein NS230_09790 [Methylobacterium indicum]